MVFRGAVRGERLKRGEIVCLGCRAPYEVVSGIAKLYVEAEVRGTDRLLRLVYDGLPSVHDPLVRFSFPFAVGESEEESRSRYLPAIQLGNLAAEVTNRPARILEIGAGTGSNVPLVRQRVSGGLPVEFWAVDLSLGMLNLLEQRMRFLGDTETRFFAADAHALPFPDAFFDRVFHIGAVNGYRDPPIALAEMARVARAGTPIVVVDERLDPSQRHGLLHRLFFRWMTIYDRHPHAPVEHLPIGAERIQVEQIGRFFYCLSFTNASAPAGVASSPSTPLASRAAPTTPGSGRGTSS